ncbi:MAG TPA: BsuPI-related putative proteinase inhibitor [Actinomycetota bacterium]|nr:BsuPI-related putative proteinase inhibitor [Actinomycetota bacterium]
MRRLLVAFALLLAGCSTGESRVAGDVRNVSDVTVNLRVEPARAKPGAAVRMTLSLMNNSGRPRTLTYPTSQRYDFWVTSGGREIWRSSSERMFGQAQDQEALQGQSGTRYAETWTPTAEGTYVVHAELKAEGFEGELSTEIAVEAS